jgi:hypothetical protein
MAIGSELSTTFLAACSLNSGEYLFGFPGTRSRSFPDKNPIGSLSGKFGAPRTDLPWPRYVIDPDVAIRLARNQAVIRGEHQILAPALLRSQVLSLLYQEGCRAAA